MSNRGAERVKKGRTRGKPGAQAVREGPRRPVAAGPVHIRFRGRLRRWRPALHRAGAQAYFCGYMNVNVSVNGCHQAGTPVSLSVWR
jgi:hypothetical protein